MSWLRNGQVSLVAVAVSAAMSLAACGGAESDDSSSIYASPAQNLKNVVAPEGSPSEAIFTEIAGADMVLTYEEANIALKAGYIADKVEEYLRSNLPKESSYDTDGNRKLEGAELTAYTTAVTQVEKDSVTYGQGLSTDSLPLFASEADLLAALDKDGNKKIEASDLDVPLIPAVTYDCGTAVSADNDNVYIIGGFTRVAGKDWTFGSQCKLTKAGDIYSINLNLTANPIKPISFKFANAGWAGSVNCGGGASKVVILGTPFTGSCGDSSSDLNLTINEAGNYKFELNNAGGGAVVTVTKQ